MPVSISTFSCASHTLILEAPWALFAGDGSSIYEMISAPECDGEDVNSSSYLERWMIHDYRRKNEKEGRIVSTMVLVSLD